jgi:hypothetical protein
MKNGNISRRSTNYQFTIDIESNVDKVRLRELRMITALKNRWRVKGKFSSREEVIVRPRLGRNSKFKPLYSNTGPLRIGARQGNYKMEHATRADVYLYYRRVTAYQF